MGNTFEVYAFLKLYDGFTNNYSYVEKYRGESFLKAIFTIIKLKINGVNCVKFEWRR